MIVNFVIWSPLISLCAIVFLYPLRFHVRGAQVSRFYAAALLFPALVSAGYVAKLTAFDGVAISQVFHISTLDVYWGVELMQQNALLNALLMTSVAMIIFFLPDKKLVEHTLLVALLALALSVIIVSPDQIIKGMAYSLGNIALIYAILSDESERRIVNKVTNDFPLHLVSDFFAFTALAYLLVHHQNMYAQTQNASAITAIAPRLSFFLAIALRVTALLGLDTGPSFRSNALIKLSIFRKLFIAAGSQILLLNFTEILFADDRLTSVYIFISVLILTWALMRAAFERKKITLADNLINIATSCCLVLLSCKLTFLGATILCGIITFFPISALVLVSGRKLSPVPEKSARLSPRFSGLFERIFLHIPMKFARLFSTFIIDALVPFYSGFLLFRLPQIVIGIIQTPLRFVHNGNLQRSLLLVAIMVISFYLLEFP